MLKRKIWNELVRWKEREHHPLILSGLRQVGKTFIVKEFGKQHYKNVVYIDLRANRSIHAVFNSNFSIDEMVLGITANIPTARFIENETLLILDEIQDCPNARSSLKYWDLDHRYDVIATGSFLGVKGFRAPYERGIPVGYEEMITMHPLTFIEFLINNGIQENIIDYISNCISNCTPIMDSVHTSIRSLYFQYLIVGGMPEVVNIFLCTHDVNQVRESQNRVIDSIKSDFGRYKDNKGNDKINEVLKLRAEGCLNSLPTQLAKDYKKFQYSLVNTKGRSQDKADGLQYLEDVGLIVKSHNIREISSPLEGVKIDTEFKVFMSDIGLLMSQLDFSTVSKVLSGDLSSYKGAIAENMVASILSANNQTLYYYRNSTGSPELDFIINIDGEPTIIECKSTNNKATSMKFVLNNPQRFGKHPAIKITDTNIGEGNGFKTFPLYALGFLIFEHHLVLPKINTDIQL